MAEGVGTGGRRGVVQGQPIGGLPRRPRASAASPDSVPSPGGIADTPKATARKYDIVKMVGAPQGSFDKEQHVPLKIFPIGRGCQIDGFETFSSLQGFNALFDVANIFEGGKLLGNKLVWKAPIGDVYDVGPIVVHSGRDYVAKDKAQHFFQKIDSKINEAGGWDKYSAITQDRQTLQADFVEQAGLENPFYKALQEQVAAGIQAAQMRGRPSAPVAPGVWNGEKEAYKNGSSKGGRDTLQIEGGGRDRAPARPRPSPRAEALRRPHPQYQPAAPLLPKPPSMWTKVAAFLSAPIGNLTHLSDGIQRVADWAKGKYQEFQKSRADQSERDIKASREKIEALKVGAMDTSDGPVPHEVDLVEPSPAPQRHADDRFEPALSDYHRKSPLWVGGGVTESPAGSNGHGIPVYAPGLLENAPVTFGDKGPPLVAPVENQTPQPERRQPVYAGSLAEEAAVLNAVNDYLATAGANRIGDLSDIRLTTEIAPSVLEDLKAKALEEVVHRIDLDAYKVATGTAVTSMQAVMLEGRVANALFTKMKERGAADVVDVADPRIVDTLGERGVQQVVLNQFYYMRGEAELLNVANRILEAKDEVALDGFDKARIGAIVPKDIRDAVINHVKLTSKTAFDVLKPDEWKTAVDLVEGLYGGFSLGSAKISFDSEGHLTREIKAPYSDLLGGYLKEVRDLTNLEKCRGVPIPMPRSETPVNARQERFNRSKERRAQRAERLYGRGLSVPASPSENFSAARDRLSSTAETPPVKRKAPPRDQCWYTEKEQPRAEL